MRTSVIQKNNIAPFVLIDNRKKSKYTLDGEKKKTHSNKQKGISSRVFAFQTTKEIEAMINVFDEKISLAPDEDKKHIAYRNKLLFLIGMNIGIRGSDLRTLKWSFFFNKKNGELVWKESYTILPEKQKKYNKFVTLYFNETVKKSIGNYINKYPINDLDDYVIFSRKGDEPLTVSGLWGIIKQTAKEAEIKQNIGSHSLRKSWGYWCWHNAKDKNKALVILQQCFGHSSTQVTAKYIGILDEEIAEMYNSVELGYEFI